MQTNREKGALGESIAVDYLLKKGYSVLERNWRWKRVEVDIIAWKNQTLHIIEVKTRTSTQFGNPETSVTKEKMASLKSAAEEYQILHPKWQWVQFDVVAILLEGNAVKEIELLEDVYI